MWKPPERIRHKVIDASWPTAEEAAGSLTFSPIEQGRLSLKQRTWIPAMVPWRASQDGLVTQDVLDWYGRFAEGKPGAIVVEATGIRDVPSGPLLRIGDDRFIPGLKELVDTVHKASNGQTKLFIQLIDFLAIKRRPQREKFLSRFLKISNDYRNALNMNGADDDAVREKLLCLNDEALEAVLSKRDFESLTRGFRERVTDVEAQHIRDLPKTLPDLFARAANRAESAGFDGVELHYAHAYTMASFLSRLNDRADGYGGSLEGRVRLPLEVLKQVRTKVADGFAIGCRILSDDCIENGSTVDDTAWFAEQLANAGMDFISLSRGGKFEDAAEPKVGEAIYPYTGPSGYECMPQIISDKQGPFGRNADPAKKIRERLRKNGFLTPVVVAGGVHHFSQTEGLLEQGAADIVGLARQALADPDWFEKVRTGYGAEVNCCKYTNYCEGLDQKHKMVTCQLWDRQELEAKDAKLSSDGKRRTTAPAWRRGNL